MTAYKLNKNQLYKFAKDQGACRDGLLRLKRLVRGPKTAKEILTHYRLCRQVYGYRLYDATVNYSDRWRAIDYSWLCMTIGESYYDLPDADRIVRGIVRTEKRK
jgi:hypothetical protein